MSHSIRPPMSNSLSPDALPLMPTPVVQVPSIVTAVDASSHVHQFVPTPAGRLFGKVLWRNRCDCGQAEHPETASMDGTSGHVRLPRGPSCRRCGFPTVDGLVDAANPLHPCCAEPALMALGSRRKDRR